jgi:hypothetical protein
MTPSGARTTGGEAAPPATTPYRLLWSTAIVAAVLSIAAFVLWGVAGAATLLDTIVALCA